MKRIIIGLFLLSLLAIPVDAQNITAPPVPPEAEKFMPESQENFLEGVLEVLRDALLALRPDLRDSLKTCLRIFSAVMLLSLLQIFPGSQQRACSLGGIVGISCILLDRTESLISLAVSTVSDISEYGKLLLPVMTAAMAGQGSITASAALYTQTAFFSSLLCSAIRKILIPITYIFLLTAIISSATENDLIKGIRDTLKSAMGWVLKTFLYLYTGFISITGVVSGATDAAALKATKLTISSMVPVVGGILSDASEAVLVSAGAIKNAAGIYGLFAILAILIGPFLKISVHYLLLKATATVCGVFCNKQCTELIQHFSSAMGMLLAMTGSISLMLYIGLVCFLRGVM